MEGHGFVRRLLPQYPEIEVVWRPCEIHGRPEPARRHSDLCIQGMFYARDQGADLWAYHDLMYRAALVEGVDIDDIGALSRQVEGLLDPEGFRRALEQGTYRQALEEANRYAFAESGVEVVPSYRLAGRALNAVEDVGVPYGTLEKFLKNALG